VIFLFAGADASRTLHKGRSLEIKLHRVQEPGSPDSKNAPIELLIEFPLAA